MSEDIVKRLDEFGKPKEILLGLVDAEAESLEGMNRDEFVDWAMGFKQGITKNIAIKVFNSYAGSGPSAKFSI